MFRQPATAGKSGTSNVKQSNSTDSTPTTIREIKSRTTSSTSASPSRQLLANRRQATSMERLNSGASTNSNSSTATEREKGSPSSGSSNSINNPANSSSPSRGGGGGGLNRTASRVSRFRSAKAVFERLSSSSNSTKPDRPSAPDKPKGTVASRYAAAAAARATTHANVPASPRSRFATSSSLTRSQESGKSASNIEINRTTNNNTQSPKNDTLHPRPQPRNTSNRGSTISSGVNRTTSGSTNGTTSSVTKNLPALAKPPPKDLIDKIVLEIAKEPEADCTIQDLSNCDISGIPETLDFDRCFQDVEMMTEEEARKLLSRKSIPSPQPQSQTPVAPENTVVKIEQQPSPILVDDGKAAETEEILVVQFDSSPVERGAKAIDEPAPQVKSKVRFSEEPVKIFDTFAVSDYDRRNDDIDPAAASAEYEIEKLKEREGIRDSEDSDDDNFEESTTSEKTSNNFIQPQIASNLGIHHDDPHNDSHDSSANNQQTLAQARHEDEQSYSREYIESLEREIGLKRILEQNLRDLQSQYYEAVRESDGYKGKLSELEENYNSMTGKLESSQNELSELQEQSKQLEKQFNDIKESSQTLEKKYHRAKRIIKDMQSREQSFNRREQLYQQKLDEIEYELGVLIESIDKTVYEDGLKFYTILTDKSAAGTENGQRQAQLDVFGLVKQMLTNFSANQSTQNPQIKQRVLAILEQQLANLMIITNGNAAVAGNVAVNSANQLNAKMALSSDSNYPVTNDIKHNHNQTYNLAAHRLSQPNLPHPIGVGGQPTKLFHALNPMPTPISNNEPSPPQSVNSYPSTNSLNSLNNNNNTTANNNNVISANNNNNNIVIAPKLRDPPATDLQMSLSSIAPSTASANLSEDKFEPAVDIQVPYQTNEWHDKPVSEWTTTQVSTWLLALGLDQYISKFEDRNVNGQSLINLDSTVLKGLGVLNSNDRNLLKKKIRELRVEMEKERKLVEKKLKENLKDKSKNKANGSNKNDSKNDMQQNKSSWKRGLLS